jgi:hypothetical protein
MKATLISISLILLLIITTATSTKQNSRDTEIDVMIIKNEEHISKADTIIKIADQRQKEKIDELHEAVCKLKKEKQMLESTLETTKHELVVIKEVFNIIPIDSNRY